MFALTGYLISLILSFVNMRRELYDYIIFVGIVFTIPAIATMRKMFLRLKEIKVISIIIGNLNLVFMPNS